MSTRTIYGWLPEHPFPFSPALIYPRSTQVPFVLSPASTVPLHHPRTINFSDVNVDAADNVDKGHKIYIAWTTDQVC